MKPAGRAKLELRAPIEYTPRTPSRKAGHYEPAQHFFVHCTSPLIRLSFALATICFGLTIRPATAAEKLPTAPIASQKLPASVDLRPKFEQWKLERRDQGVRGTCSVFAFTGALEFATAKEKNQGERLSVEYLNWASNQAVGRDQDGGFFSDMWKGFTQYGICAEKQMPYQEKFDPAKPPGTNVVAEAKTKLEAGLSLHWIKRWNVRTGLKDDEFADIKRTLNQGWPVCGGFRWPHHEEWKQDVLQMRPPEGVFDGHSILLVGYRDDADQPGGGVFIFRNTNHDGRDGFMPYEYARAYMNDAVWIDSPSKTNSAAAAPHPALDPSPRL